MWLINGSVGGFVGGVGGCALPADGRRAPWSGAHAQGELRCKERVRDDPELQGPAGRLQQAQDHQGFSPSSVF